jgi:hypothetical protein
MSFYETRGVRNRRYPLITQDGGNGMYEKEENMRYESGDRVVIQTNEFFNRQEKSGGTIISANGDHSFTGPMWKYAGMTACIISAKKAGLYEYYYIDLDHGKHIWEPWMFSRHIPFDEWFVESLREPAEPPKKRQMTRLEMLWWAGSEESRGWVVRVDTDDSWQVPQYLSYISGSSAYQRARLLPGGSGIDKDSICGFEVEE